MMNYLAKFYSPPGVLDDLPMSAEAVISAADEEEAWEAAWAVADDEGLFEELEWQACEPDGEFLEPGVVSVSPAENEEAEFDAECILEDEY